MLVGDFRHYAPVAFSELEERGFEQLICVRESISFKESIQFHDISLRYVENENVRFNSSLEMQKCPKEFPTYVYINYQSDQTSRAYKQNQRTFIVHL